MQNQPGFLSKIIDSTMDAIVSTDENQNIIIFNHAAELMFGYRAADIIGQPLAALIPARFRASHQQHIENFGKTGITTRTMNMPGVSYALRANGEEFIFEASISQVEINGTKIYTAILRDISVRKRMEERLQLTQFASDHAPDCIFWVDQQARICYVNEATCHELKYTKEELLAMSIPDIDPDFPAAVWPAHWRELQQKDTLTFETRHKRKDGSIYPVEVSANFVKFGDKEFNIGFSRDITERKQYMLLLEASQKYFKTLFDSSNDGMFILGRQGNILHVNRSAYTRLGYSEEELRAMHITELDTPEFAAKVPQRIAQIANDGTAVFEAAHCRKDGSVMPVEVSSRIIELGGDQVFLSVIRDITERKQAEIALRRQRDLNRCYLDTVQTMVVALDCEGRVTMINHAGCALLGYKEDELLGRNWFTTCLPQPDGMDQVLPVFHELMAGHVDTVRYFENRVLCRDGSKRLIVWHNTILSDEHDKIIGTLGSGDDITERKQTEEALRIASTAFESHESMVITDANGVILQVNQAFTEATGYTAEEAVGQTPRMLKSGRHHADFYRAMWETLLRTGKWQGEVWDRCKNGRIYPKLLTISAVKKEDGVITHYVGVAHDITARKMAEEEIKNLAFYDSLTQLPNRRLLGDRLGNAIAASTRSGRYGALMFLDLDNFKPLNDTHGHDVGDLLLVEAARRIAGCVRKIDTVARFGGDEFVVVLSELDKDKAASTAQTCIVAEKISAILAAPYRLKIPYEKEVPIIVEHHCTASIGVMLFIDHEARAEDIIKWADMAMYEAKEAGRNNIRFYKPEM